MSVCPSTWDISAPNERTSWNLIFQKVSLKLASIMGTLHDDLHTFKIISHWILRMRNVSDKNCRENHNTHFIFSNFILKNCAVYEIMWGGQGPPRGVEPMMMIMWKNMVEPDRPQMTVLCKLNCNIYNTRIEQKYNSPSFTKIITMSERSLFDWHKSVYW